MSEEKEGYEVGYGKPPASGRFTKGNSGNPKGRPKGARNLATIVLKESRQPVRINGPRGPRTITKLDATVKQLTNKAVQGDHRASSTFLALVQSSEETAAAETAPRTVHESDQRVIQSLRLRLESPKAEAIMMRNGGAEGEGE